MVLGSCCTSLASVRVTTGFCRVGPDWAKRMLTLSGVPRGVLPGAGAGLEARLHPVRTTSSPSSSRLGRRERFFFIDMADSLESMRSIKMRQGQQATARVGPSINRDTCPPGRVPTTFLPSKSRGSEHEAPLVKTFGEG